MKPTAYFDLNLAQPHDLPHWERLGVLWRTLHRASAASGVAYAVAFPQWMKDGFTLGSKMRVFCEGAESANKLYDVLELHDLQAALDSIGAAGTRVRKVQTDHITGHEAYLMQRIPSGVSKQGALSAQVKRELREVARLRRMAEQRALPFVWMESSSGNRFKLVIERALAASDLVGAPNGYGLSRKTQVIALPVLA